MKVETDAVLVLFLKVRRDGAEMTSAWKSFCLRAPATRKARRPIVGRIDYMTSRVTMSLTNARTHASLYISFASVVAKWRKSNSRITCQCQYLSISWLHCLYVSSV